MKSRMLLALPLAATLMIPAAAQQDTTSNPNQSQPATTQSAPSQSSQAQPDQGTAARQPLTMERHEGFWGKINPFARKKYVNRQLDPVRNRVNELDELTASNSKMIRDVDSRAQEGIRLSMAKATEADQHALDAANRAQMAHQTALQASTRLDTVQKVVTNLDQYQAVNQTEIRFRPGQAALSKRAKDALDEIATNVKSQKGYIIEVQGFSPGSGPAAIESSRNMAQSVVRYLVLNHEIPVYRIYTVGMGNAPLPARADGTKARRTRGGRVEISLLKNNLDQLNAEPIPASGATTGTEGGVGGAATQPQYAPSSQPQSAPSQQNYQSQPQSQSNAPADNASPSSPTTTPTTTEQPAQPSPNTQPQSVPRM